MNDVDDETPWVTASAVGQATYCPYQLYLASGGTPPDAVTHRALDAGTRAHATWNVERHRAETGRRSAARARLVLTVLGAVAAIVLAVAVAIGIVVAARLSGFPQG